MGGPPSYGWFRVENPLETWIFFGGTPILGRIYMGLYHVYNIMAYDNPRRDIITLSPILIQWGI